MSWLVKEARGWIAGRSDDSRRMVWLMNRLCDEVEMLRTTLEFVDYHINRDNTEAKETIRIALGADVKAAGATTRKGVGDGEKRAAANPEPATPAADPFQLTDADRRHILFKHYSLGSCDCASCSPLALEAKP
jgi:hypothetical protein